MKTVAMILAAGSSSRMGFPKQTAALGAQTVLARTLSAFEAAACIDGILLVARPADKPLFADICQTGDVRKLLCICNGGDTRQQSAENGLRALPPDCDFLVVHDGARPLVTPELIEKAVAAAKEHGAAAVAVPVKDTIKVADPNGFIASTPDRRTLWQVQTPQVFRLTAYRQALAAALRDGCDFTDDCQLFEHCGLPVKLIEGSYTNIKITTPEDLKIAGALL